MPAVGAFHRAQLGMGLGYEIVCIYAGGKHGGYFARRGIRLYGGGQHHHIGLVDYLLVCKQVHALHHKMIVLRVHLAYLTLNVINIVFFHRAAIELIEVLAGGYARQCRKTCTFTSGYLSRISIACWRYTCSISWSNSTCRARSYHGCPRTE